MYNWRKDSFSDVTAIVFAKRQAKSGAESKDWTK